MSDLAKRMRENAATCDRKDPFEACLQDDLERGADEIERLRAAIAEAFEPGCDCATCELHREALRDE